MAPDLDANQACQVFQLCPFDLLRNVAALNVQTHVLGITAAKFQKQPATPLDSPSPAGISTPLGASPRHHNVVRAILRCDFRQQNAPSLPTDAQNLHYLLPALANLIVHPAIHQHNSQLHSARTLENNSSIQYSKPFGLE